MGPPDKGTTWLGLALRNPGTALDDLTHPVHPFRQCYRATCACLPAFSLHLLLHELVRRAAHEDVTRCRRVLEGCGQMNRLPHGRIEPLGFMPQAPDDHRSRVHADGDGQVLGVLWLWKHLLQGERRQHRPSCVVFMCSWSPKQGHATIHPILDHAAAIPLHGGLHTRQERLHVMMHRLSTQPRSQGCSLAQATA